MSKLSEKKAQKAVKDFNDWCDELAVPADILNALEEQAEKIDKKAVDRYYWCYRKGIDCAMYYAQALTSIITEHYLAQKNV